MNITSASKRQELILPVEWEVLDTSAGFSFDMGGSVMKLAFVDKNDYVEPQNRKPDSKGQLHLVNFSRTELDQAFQFIQERVRITHPNDLNNGGKQDGSDIMPLIYTTGVGGSQFVEKLNEKINVRNQQLPEFDCFNQSFMYLTTKLPRSEILYPFNKEAYEKNAKQFEYRREMFRAMKGSSAVMDKMIEAMEKMVLKNEQINETYTDEPIAADSEFFPCGIMMCGSAFVFSVIQSDGTSQAKRGSLRGGKMFLGLSSLLLQTNDFNEIMELASKGNCFNVSFSNRDVLRNTKKTSENDIYGKVGELVAMEEYHQDEEESFCFAKADGKRIEDFNREDLARCLLETTILELVHYVIETAHACHVKHVFFCGGFVNHPLVREILTQKWLKDNQQMFSTDPEMAEEKHLHFLVHGQSLGVIGALLNNKLDWINRNKELNE